MSESVSIDRGGVFPLQINLGFDSGEGGSGRGCPGCVGPVGHGGWSFRRRRRSEAVPRRVVAGRQAWEASYCQFIRAMRSCRTSDSAPAGSTCLGPPHPGQPLPLPPSPAFDSGRAALQEL